MAENAASQPAASASRQQPKYFFLNRRPKLRGVPREAVPDSSTAGYQKRLADEGFIALNDWPQATQALREDVRELEQYLMPSFWRMDQLARYYQNRHYLYQWIFILSAFLTTAFSAISVFLNGTTQDVSLGLFDLTDLLAGLTVAVSGIAAMVSFLNANQAPQQNWFKARAKAESLRSLYFTFMARRPPFAADTGRERSRFLGQAVLDILSDKKQEGANQ